MRNHFIALPTKWDVTPKDVIEAAELVGQDYEEVLEDGIMRINPNLIAEYHEGGNKNQYTVISLNGSTYRINLNIREFEVRLQEFYLNVARLQEITLQKSYEQHR